MRTTPQAYDLPAYVDVIVIGGGIIGSAAAFFLALGGTSVLLCDKGAIGSEQSGRNQGWVKISNRQPVETEIALEAGRLWRSLNEMIGAETGYKRSGAIFIASTEADMARYETWLKGAEEFRSEIELLSAGEFSRLFPSACGKMAGALYARCDGRAEPELATRAIAASARQFGAIVLDNCAALGLVLANGRVTAVETERGTVTCNSVILAGGAWSSLFLRRYGVEIPQLKVRSSVMKISGVNGPDVNIFGKSFLARKRMDGGYTVAHAANHSADIVPDSFRYFSSFMPMLRRRWPDLPLLIGRQFFRELDYTRRMATAPGHLLGEHRAMKPVPRPRRSLRALEALKQFHPAFRTARVDAHWAGLVDITPDELPVISPVDKIDGLIVATGFSARGFAIGPSAGKLAADLATGRRTSINPSPFKLSRFQAQRA